MCNSNRLQMVEMTNVYIRDSHVTSNKFFELFKIAHL